MKMMILLATLLISASAFAAQVSFTYFGNEGGNQHFYACSYAEDQTYSHLEALGATNIDVSCFGGIQSTWVIQPVSLRATYDLPVVTGAGTQKVKIKGDSFNPACGLNVRIMKEILKTFTNVTVVKKSDSCAFAQSNYYYNLDVTL